jgi:hypothetical protein
VILGLGFVLIGGFALFFTITGKDPIDALRASLSGMESPAPLPTSGSRTITDQPVHGGRPGQSPEDVRGSTGGSPARNRALARALAAAQGWTGAEWEALNRRWTMESGFDHHAVNPSSGACGIPQRLPAAHPFRSEAERRSWMDSPAKQIAWGINYVKSRYGKPSNIPTSGPY